MRDDIYVDAVGVVRYRATGKKVQCIGIEFNSKGEPVAVTAHKVDEDGEKLKVCQTVLTKGINEIKYQYRLKIWWQCVLQGKTYAQVNRTLIKSHPKLFSQHKDVSNYVALNKTMNERKVAALAEALDLTYDECREIYTPPAERGVGDYWIGEFGSKIKDYEDPEKMKEKGTPLSEPEPFDYSELFKAMKATTDSLSGAGCYATEEMINEQLKQIHPECFN